MYKMVVSDLDGTLLDRNSKITKENVRAIKKLNENGIKFVIMSGRSYNQIKEIADMYGLECEIVGLNGCETIDEYGDIVHTHYLKYEDVAYIVQACDEDNVLYEIYTTDGMITKKCDNILDNIIALAKLHETDDRKILEFALNHYDLIYNNRTLIDDVAGTLVEDDSTYIKFVIFDANTDKLQKISDKLKHLKDINITSSFISNIEIGHKDVSKGNGVKYLSELYDIDINDIVCIGDNFNDVSMLEIAGLSVAMGNAADEIKNLADKVTETNVESGVAYAINEFVLK